MACREHLETLMLGPREWGRQEEQPQEVSIGRGGSSQ